MATYLTLTNRVLNELNEVELTSTNFGSSRGVQTMVKNVVNKSIHDVYNSEIEWSFLYGTKTQQLTAGTRTYAYPSDARKINFSSFMLQPTNLITNGTFTNNISDWTTVSGTPFHTKAVGDGAIRLNAAETTQSISTVKNKDYIVRARTFGGDITLKIGTSSGGTQISSSTLSITNLGDGEYSTTRFTATASTIYIGFANSASADYDVEKVEVTENFQPERLVHLSYNEWLDTRGESDLSTTSASQFGLPRYVYRTQDNSNIGLSPIPDKSSYSVTYDYYITHSDLSAYNDTPTLPDRFNDIIVNRAKYYAYMMRANMAGAQLAEKDYLEGIKRMRVELINHQNYFYPAGLTSSSRRFVGINT